MREEKHNKKIFSAGDESALGGQNPDVLKWFIIGLAGFIVVVLIFAAGVKVGTLKAKYSYRWAESYHKNFAGPRDGFLGDWRRFPAGDFIGGHGAFGEIIELNDTGFVVKGRSDIEKIIITTDDTVVKKGRETVEDGFKVGDRVTIIGSPNEKGQIEAKLIRVFSEDNPKRLPLRKSRSNFFF